MKTNRKGSGRNKPQVSGRTLARMVKPAKKRGAGGPISKQLRALEQRFREEEKPR